MEIFYRYSDFNKITIENDKDNEFIFVNEGFIKLADIKDIAYKNIEIKNVDKEKKTIEIKVNDSEHTFHIAKKKEDYIFKIIKDINISNSSGRPGYMKNPLLTSSTLYMVDEYNKSKVINETLDLVPLLYCMTNISYLNIYFLNHKPKNNNNGQLMISTAFAELIYNMIYKKNDNIHTLNLDTFKKKIGNKKDSYEANNLFIFLYNTMHKELNTKNNNGIVINDNSDRANKQNQIEKKKREFNGKNDSVIIDTFYFLIVKEYKCVFCNSVLYDCEMNHHLIFSLNNIIKYKTNICQKKGFLDVDIYDCFDYFSKSKKPCDMCPNETEIKNTLNTLPKIMTVIFDRNNVSDYINFYIDFDIDLSRYLDNYIKENENENIAKYELIGILSYYIGQNKDLRGAFYKSYKYNKWYFYHNSKIECIYDIMNEDKGIPILLFYQQKFTIKQTKLLISK